MKKFLNIKHPLYWILISIVMLSLFSLTSFADDHDKIQSLVNTGKIQPLEAILQRLYKIEVGHILEVELEKKKKRLIYEIEIVNEDGVVKEYLFDAKSGELIKEHFED